MILSGSYVGCHVIIQDSKGNEFARSTVMDYNKDYMMLAIEGEYREANGSGDVNLLIVMEDGMHSYSGKLRRCYGIPVWTEISLFKGQLQQEIRSARRYSVNTEAVIDYLYVASKPARLLHPLQIRLVNLSATGALIQAQPNSFRKQAIVKMGLSIGGNDTVIYGRIVRIQDIANTVTEYGCQFVAVN